MIKICTRCEKQKVLGEYPKHCRRKDGHGSVCKECDAKAAAYWRAANPGANAKQSASWRKRFPEKARASDAFQYYEREDAAARAAANKLWNANNKELAAATKRAWRIANAGFKNACEAARKARRMKATPAWANEFYIAEIYDLAQRRTKSLGIKYQVDHIVPLTSKFVCGLHCEHNLQVIPAPINASKGNRHWPDMPEVRM